MIRKLLNFRRGFVIIRRMSTEIKKTVETQQIGKVLLIGINRPEKRNAVDPNTAEQLVEAFTKFETDSDSLVAVLYGKGGSFCAGFDLSALLSMDEDNLIKMRDKATMGPSRMCLSKPVIAAVSGYAVAGGLELACLCDLRVVEESAIMGVFCRRFGVPLIDGGTVRLQKLIGLSRAMDMILTGRGVTAQEALQFGLANRVAKTGAGLAEAVQLANSLLKFPQKCMNTDRESAYYAAYRATSLEDALKYEYDNGINVIQEESIPGARKFIGGQGKHGSFNPNKPGKHKL